MTIEHVLLCGPKKEIYNSDILSLYYVYPNALFITYEVSNNASMHDWTEWAGQQWFSSSSKVECLFIN